MKLKRPMGRPHVITKEKEEIILRRLESGESGSSICRDEVMPCWTTLCKYRNEHEDFAHRYARSKCMGIEFLLEEVDLRVRDESRDYYTDSKGERRSDNTAVQRDRLIADQTKWTASKLFPKQYGDKITNELTGPEGKELQTVLNITVEK